MSRAALVVFACALGACGSKTEAPRSTAPREAAAEPSAGRCALSEGVAPTPSNPAIRDSIPWVTRGPGGVRLVAQAHRFDGNFESFGLFVATDTAPIEADIGVGTPGSVAWTGSVFLAIARDRIVAYDQTFSRELRRHAFPPGACHASLAEGHGGAIAVWGRPDGARGCFESKPWVQRFDALGVPLGAPTPLGTSTLARRISARWDFGRFVVTAETARGGVHSWVLDVDGALLGERDAHVACARVGCVAVESSIEQTSEQLDLTAQVLRVNFVAADAGGFASTASAREVRGLIVSGDRVLVLHEPPSRVGCGLTVIDLARRSTIVQLQSDAMICAEAHARPRTRGFTLTERDPSLGPVTRVIDCWD